MKICVQCKLQNDDWRKACKSCGSEKFVPAADAAEKRAGGDFTRGAGEKREPATKQKKNETTTRHGKVPTATPIIPTDHVPPPPQPAPIIPAPADDRRESCPPSYPHGVRGWLRQQFSEHFMRSLSIASFLLGVLGLVLTIVGLPQVLSAFRWATNSAPIIRIVKASPQAIPVGGSVDLTALVEDDGGRLDPSWTSSAGRLQVNGMEATLSTAGMKIQSAPASITVSLTVKDEQGEASKQYDVTIPVSKNAPRLRMIRPDKMELSVGEPVTLIAVADDPDGSKELRYEWSCPVGQIDRSNSFITTLQTAGMNIRSAPIFPRVTLTVTDEQGESTTGDVILSITPKPRVYRRAKSKRAEPFKLVVNVVQPVNPNAPKNGASPTAEPQGQTQPTLQPPGKAEAPAGPQAVQTPGAP